MKKTISYLLALMMLLSAVGASAFTYADTVSWQGAYDVVVVGFGGAGSVAAKTAADAGARVLIVEKAPEGQEGGNTRFSGQFFVYGNDNPEDTFAYYKALGGKHAVPEDMLRTYTNRIATLADTVAEWYGLDKADFVDANDLPSTSGMSPEYPELPGAASISLMATHNGNSDGYLWGKMRQSVVDRADRIDVWYESPAVHLIQDPQSKAIVGVEVTRNGEAVRIRADRGVVLACGGFENNPEMVETYLGLTKVGVFGTLYNTGDGIRMAQEVGADLWHMHVYEGIVNTGATSKVVGENERAGVVVNPAFSGGSSILISGAGTRFLNESEILRHGHMKNGDVYVNPSYPETIYALMDEAQYQMAVAIDASLGSYGFIDGYQYLTVGENLQDLAAKLSIGEAELSDTVTRFNSAAEAGFDPQFGRAAEAMKPIAADGPLYAFELIPNMLNTQGGPRRNVNAEVLDPSGNPIPRLYSAGELGGICSLQYQGGGNIAECLIFGEIAGTNAAAEKAALPEYIVPAPVESTLTYVPGAVSDLVPSGESPVALAENQRYGQGTGMGGALGVVVTLDGDTITAIDIVLENETEGVGTPALKQLPARIIEANSTDVDIVTGATITSNAILEAVNAALAG